MLSIPALLILALQGCGGGSGPPGVSEADARRISLFAQDTVSIEVPGDSRGGVEPPTEMPLSGPWQYAGKTPAGMHKWSHPIPIRPRGLFFYSPEPGISLRPRDGDPLEYARYGARSEEYWSHSRKVVFLYRPEKGSPPSAGDYVFSYPKATERERAMNLSMTGGLVATDFVHASVHHDWNTRKGLLLPAPARMVWDVVVPPSAELLMAPGINEPELLDGPGSDGATLVVSIEVGGVAAEVERIALEPGKFPQMKLDLAAWSNQAVRLIFDVEPGSTPNFDYAFIGDPILSSRKSNSKRVVMVFVDTLRADHMSLYGYERPTSAKLDQWAASAAVFENARSVAPWTLPSGRAIVTGRHPEHYYSTQTVQKILSDQGFASAMIAGNVYLSTNFDMARDWGWHSVGMWPRAGTITDDALEWLRATEGHDAILQVHYMDAHLPYLEPKSYRKLFAGESVGGLGEEFHLPDVRSAPTGDPAVRQYVMDRYDNNVRYATDEVVRLLEHLDDDDIVVFYADHGEEFWDHGGFEHGHQLFDELIHVPLVFKGPGVTGTRVTQPASILDITPTILAALGIEDPETRDGVDLLPAARGESVVSLEGRELAFGRPLYGVERWGVLSADNKKWMTSDGRQQAYDLEADPGERNDILLGKDNAAAVRYQQILGEQLHTEAGVAYRIVGAGMKKRQGDDLEVQLTIPGGVKYAWNEHDPVGDTYAKDPVISEPNDAGDQTVTAIWPGSSRGQGTIWVVPTLPIEEVTHSLTLIATSGDTVVDLEIPQNRAPGIDGNKGFLVSRVVGGRNLRFGFGIGPVPQPGWQGVDATSDEARDELEAAGYLFDDEDEPAPAPRQAPKAP